MIKISFFDLSMKKPYENNENNKLYFLAYRIKICISSLIYRGVVLGAKTNNLNFCVVGLIKLFTKARS